MLQARRHDSAERHECVPEQGEVVLDQVGVTPPRREIGRLLERGEHDVRRPGERAASALRHRGIFVGEVERDVHDTREVDGPP